MFGVLEDLAQVLHVARVHEHEDGPLFVLLGLGFASWGACLGHVGAAHDVDLVEFGPHVAELVHRLLHFLEDFGALLGVGGCFLLAVEDAGKLHQFNFFEKKWELLLYAGIRRYTPVYAGKIF